MLKILSITSLHSKSNTIVRKQDRRGKLNDNIEYFLNWEKLLDCNQLIARTVFGHSDDQKSMG